MTNTTQGFSSTVSSTFLQWTAPDTVKGVSPGAAGFPPTPQISVETDFSSGASCASLQLEFNAVANGAAWQVGTGTALPPHSTVDNWGYLIISNYYNPQFPSGERQLFDNIVLQLGGGWTLKTLVGPGVPTDATDPDNYNDAGTIPFSGATLVCANVMTDAGLSPNCSAN
jgi:hypothetical protein